MTGEVAVADDGYGDECADGYGEDLAPDHPDAIETGVYQDPYGGIEDAADIPAASTSSGTARPVASPMSESTLRADAKDATEALDRWLLPVLQASLRQAKARAHLWKSACEELQDITANAIPDQEWKVLPFGSAVNGFCTGKSDLDVTICQTVVDLDGEDANVDRAAILKRLCRRIEKKHWRSFFVEMRIFRARIPILKLVYRDSLEVDLSVENVFGVRNSRLLGGYANLGSDVLHLATAVKLWAKGNDVCGAYKHNLSAYAFVLLSIYFLQVSAFVKLPCLQSIEPGDLAFNDDFTAETVVKEAVARRRLEQRPVADLLAKFFHFYVNDFLWDSEVASIRLGARRKTISQEFHQLQILENRLNIEDPFERSRNLCDVLGREQEEKLREALAQADMAVKSGKTLAIWGKVATAAVGTASPPAEGSITVATADVEAPAEGYLSTLAGDCLEVHGVEDDEAESWLYAKQVGSDRFGWLSASHTIRGHPKCLNKSVALPPTDGTPGCLFIAVALANVRAPSNGYLDLRTGEDVSVKYIGTVKNGDNGWLYGATRSAWGWFPEVAVISSTYQGIMLDEVVGASYSGPERHAEGSPTEWEN
mmetsp:Transcript_26614/g.62137  ORF Transcript_26614/g.62137 Transcript_26614/m.62137 type:complete len:596 (+) Transcript_26614:141-1928(+)